MSITTNIGLFKHDNPATNTDEFNVDKALNQNWDKIDEAFGEDRERISTLETDNTTNKQDITEIKAKDTDQDKYIAELEAENTRLREDLNGLPKGQASGESIDLSDSAEMRCEVKISGNSKQETRSGKNLFKNELKTKIINGITFTINDDKSITANGTATGNADINLYYGNFSLPKGVYFLSGCPKGGSSTTYRIGMNKGNVSASDNIFDVGDGAEYVIDTDMTNATVWIIIYAGVTVNNLVFKPMLVKGSTATPYEPYGASPSPDYPSENESCGDNINLYNAPYRENNKLIITATQDDYYKILSYYAYLEAGKKYRVSFESDGSYGMDSGTDTIQIFLMKDKSFDTIITIFSKNEIISPTVSGNYYIRADVNKNGKSHSFWNFKIEKGSTASPYSPYGQGCINEVICNKNLISNELKSFNDYGLTTIVKEDKSFTMSGTTTQQCTFTIWSGKIILNGSIYVGMPCRVKYFTKDGNARWDYWGIGVRNVDNISLVHVYLQYASGTTLNETMFPMICYSNIAVPYVEHKSQTYTIPVQQPFRAIGDIRDTFIKKNNKWYERHYITRYYLTGNEKYDFGIKKENYTLIYTVDTPIKTTAYWKNNDTNNNKYVKSNFFSSDMTAAAQWGNNTTNNITINSNKAIGININNAIATSVDELKVWLQNQYNAGAPVYVDYVLAEPLDIECTEEQNKILDQIEKEVKTYKNVTHMYSTDKISSYKEVTYKKDIDTYIDNKISPVINAVIELGGNINV